MQTRKLAWGSAAGLAMIGMVSVGFAQGTVGPSGEIATPHTELSLNDAELTQLQEGSYTAALLWHVSDDFVDAVSRGAHAEFERMGIQIVAETSAGFDAAQQTSDAETVMARSPSVIVTLPVDPFASAAAFRPALESGVSLVLLSNVPDGYRHGADYVAIVTDDVYEMGTQAAHALADAIGDAGEIAMIYFDADYYVTNLYDSGFAETIGSTYPDITIVARQGFADPARAEEITQALLTQNPDLGGIYATWSEPAEGILAALRSSGNTHTKVVTLGITEPLALNMIAGGNVAAIVVDRAYDLGRSLAVAAGYGLLDKLAPGFVTVGPALTVTAENVVEGWTVSLHRDAPQSILDATE